MPMPTEAGIHAAFTVPEVVPLRTSIRESIYLRASQRFTYMDHPDRKGERKVSTLEYAYTLAEDQGLHRQFCSWEWQPAGGSASSQPHVHVRRGCPEARGLGKLHIPTGRVAFEQVLEYAMSDHDVVPISADALDGMRESLRRFSTHKSW